MALDFTGLNWIAILVALVAHMILGAVWFGVFARPWAALAHPGRSKEEIQAGPKWIYGIAALGGLVTAIVLAATFKAVGATTIAAAVSTTMILWIGLVLVKYATTYAFGWRPWKLLALDVGYPLVSMLLQAIIIAGWP